MLLPACQHCQVLKTLFCQALYLTDTCSGRTRLTTNPCLCLAAMTHTVADAISFFRRQIACLLGTSNHGRFLPVFACVVRFRQWLPSFMELWTYWCSQSQHDVGQMQHWLPVTIWEAFSWSWELSWCKGQYFDNLTRMQIAICCCGRTYQPHPQGSHNSVWWLLI